MTTEKELIDRCKQGKPMAYSQLYEQTATAVYNSIYRLIRNTAEAEDILQESFVAAFQSIGKCKDTGGFKAWVKRIAINKSIDWLRRKKLTLVELEPDWKLNEEEMVDEEVFEFTVHAVAAAVESLPQAYRTIVYLFVLENMSHSAIANLLGIEYTTVRQQYSRAKQRILKSLKKEGYYE